MSPSWGEFIILLGYGEATQRSSESHVGMMEDERLTSRQRLATNIPQRFSYLLKCKFVPTYSAPRR